MFALKRSVVRTSAAVHEILSSNHIYICLISLYVYTCVQLVLLWDHVSIALGL